MIPAAADDALGIAESQHAATAAESQHLVCGLARSLPDGAPVNQAIRIRAVALAERPGSFGAITPTPNTHYPAAEPGCPIPPQIATRSHRHRASLINCPSGLRRWRHGIIVATFFGVARWPAVCRPRLDSQPNTHGLRPPCEPWRAAVRITPPPEVTRSLSSSTINAPASLPRRRSTDRQRHLYRRGPVPGIPRSRYVRIAPSVATSR